jgi:alanyl-tRNA synthetase
MHTATHLLLKALQEVLGPDVHQRGSNINEERIRFDFSYPEKMTDEQIKKVEDIVNEKITENLPVIKTETTVEEAKKKGAEAQFTTKYGDKVTLYSIGEYSNELCGGPHVKSTGEIGKFKIIKEESSSSGIRRLRAILE